MKLKSLYKKIIYLLFTLLLALPFIFVSVKRLKIYDKQFLENITHFKPFFINPYTIVVISMIYFLFLSIIIYRLYKPREKKRDKIRKFDIKDFLFKVMILYSILTFLYLIVIN